MDRTNILLAYQTLLTTLRFVVCRYQLLSQLLNFHVPNDSEMLASTLLEAGGRFAPLWQVAVDMGDRLGMGSTVLQVLLNQGHFYDAVRLAQQYPSYLVKGPRKVDWWNGVVTIAKESGDLSMFVLLSRFFEVLPVEGALPAGGIASGRISKHLRGEM